MTDKATGKAVSEFRGIRFGKSTEGPRRFKKPEPVDKWSETYDASSFGAACPQLALEELFGEDAPRELSEDCLFLNVLVPRPRIGGEKFSVMVWIYGGGLLFGHSHYYDGMRIAVDGDVIFISLNYRINVFGFMSLGDPAARGNYGFWDQKLALQWVHDNIAAFGGDPGSVTIFGESAGGWSASFQSLIPSNRGLFQRVIAQSGVVSRYGILRNRMIKKFLNVMPERTNCSSENIPNFVECLRTLSVDDLLKATDYWQDMPEDGVSVDAMYGIAIDGELFPEHPYLLLEDPNSEMSKFFKSLDFIAGTTSQEGSLLYMELMPHLTEKYNFDVAKSVPAEFVCKGMAKLFVEANYGDRADVYEAICKFYTSDGSSSDQSLRAADLYADILFTPAVAEMLDFHKGGTGRTYQYIFSKINPKPFGPPAPEWFKGSGHGDDLLFLFHIDEDGKGGFFDAKLDDVNKRFSDAMIKYWSEFAKTGYEQFIAF